MPSLAWRLLNPFLNRQHLSRPFMGFFAARGGSEKLKRQKQWENESIWLLFRLGL
jgi:hypothetical protein